MDTTDRKKLVKISKNIGIASLIGGCVGVVFVITQKVNEQSEHINQHTLRLEEYRESINQLLADVRTLRNQ